MRHLCALLFVPSFVVACSALQPDENVSRPVEVATGGTRIQNPLIAIDTDPFASALPVGSTTALPSKVSVCLVRVALVNAHGQSSIVYDLSEGAPMLGAFAPLAVGGVRPNFPDEPPPTDVEAADPDDIREPTKAPNGRSKIINNAGGSLIERRPVVLSDQALPVRLELSVDPRCDDEQSLPMGSFGFWTASGTHALTHDALTLRVPILESSDYSGLGLPGFVGRLRIQFSEQFFSQIDYGYSQNGSPGLAAALRDLPTVGTATVVRNN
jgi:hypothetical protein